MEATLTHEEVIRLQTVNAGRPLIDDHITKGMFADCLISYDKLKIRQSGLNYCFLTALGRKLLAQHLPVVINNRVGISMGPHKVSKMY